MMIFICGNHYFLFFSVCGKVPHPFLRIREILNRTRFHILALKLNFRKLIKN